MMIKFTSEKHKDKEIVFEKWESPYEDFLEVNIDDSYFNITKSQVNDLIEYLKEGWS